MRAVPMISADEYDALTKGGRRYLRFRPGERAAIKRSFRRRERRKTKPRPHASSASAETDGKEL